VYGGLIFDEFPTVWSFSRVNSGGNWQNSVRTKKSEAKPQNQTLYD
jgi:hypothetical protein